MSNYSRDQVMQVIASVMDKTSPTESGALENIHVELESLAKIIDDMHAEIVASGGHNVGGKHVQTATDELDAVILTTEEASATIMDSCDEIQKVAENIDDETKNKIFEQTTKIFEACSFQDITGQRISKVISTLREIETSVDSLLGMFGPVSGDVPKDVDTRTEDEQLLNGPQLEGKGVSQEEIDKLLAEFD